MSFPALKNDTFLRAARCQSVPHVPVWLMRQAGRYLEEYRATRRRAGSFLNLVHNPEWAAEVALQPLARYDLDASIVFSDILVLPDAMGLELGFGEGEGPYFNRPTDSEAAIRALSPPDLSRLEYVFKAIQVTRRALAGRVPLIGFSGSPFTLACYMVDGSGKPSDGKEAFTKTRQMLYQRPQLFRDLIAVNTQAVASYLEAQAVAGAQALMLFDTWGGLLPYHAYLELSLEPMAAVIRKLQQSHPEVPCILFTKGGGALEAQLASGAQVVGLDATASLGKARRLALSQGVGLQGNLDPLVLLAGEEAIRAAVKTAVDDWGSAGVGFEGWIFNLGHGITQHTPPQAVDVLIEAIRDMTRIKA